MLQRACYWWESYLVKHPDIPPRLLEKFALANVTYIDHISDLVQRFPLEEGINYLYEHTAFNFQTLQLVLQNPAYAPEIARCIIIFKQKEMLDRYSLECNNAKAIIDRWHERPEILEELAPILTQKVFDCLDKNFNYKNMYVAIKCLRDVDLLNDENIDTLSNNPTIIMRLITRFSNGELNQTSFNELVLNASVIADLQQRQATHHHYTSVAKPNSRPPAPVVSQLGLFSAPSDLELEIEEIEEYDPAAIPQKIQY